MPKPLTPSKKLRKKQLLSNKHVRSGRRKTLRELEQASKLIGSETGSGKKKDLVWGLVQNKKFAAVAAIVGSAVAISFVNWYYTKGNEKTAPELAKLTNTSLQEAKKLKDILQNPVVIKAGKVTLPDGDTFEASEDTYVIPTHFGEHYQIAVPLKLYNWLLQKKYEFKTESTTPTHIISKTCPFGVTQIKEYMPHKNSIFLEKHVPYNDVFRIDVGKNISLHYLLQRSSIQDNIYYPLLHTHFLKDDQIDPLKKCFKNFTKQIPNLPDEYIVFKMDPNQLHEIICKTSRQHNVLKKAMKETDLCNWWGKKVYTEIGN
jgi:hypothetical protein